jgi:hypothetical protein
MEIKPYWKNDELLLDLSGMTHTITFRSEDLSHWKRGNIYFDTKDNRWIKRNKVNAMIHFLGEKPSMDYVVSSKEGGVFSLDPNDWHYTTRAQANMTVKKRKNSALSPGVEEYTTKQGMRYRVRLKVDGVKQTIQSGISNIFTANRIAESAMAKAKGFAPIKYHFNTNLGEGTYHGEITNIYAVPNKGIVAVFQSGKRFAKVHLAPTLKTRQQILEKWNIMLREKRQVEFIVYRNGKHLNVSLDVKDLHYEQDRQAI